MRYAVIDDGVVANIAAADEAFAAEQGWVAAPAGVDVGWTYDGAFAAPIVPIAELYQARLADLANVRWQRETGGIVVEGTPIKTDRESQGLLTSAYVMARQDPAFSVNWKVGNGIFVPIPAETIIIAGEAVTAHVQACFAHEGLLTDEMTAAYASDDAEALEAIDITAGWPT